ncbi:SRPBCC family protein [Pseudooceanicola algae]|uniref:Uncharacterized protein n=1 Tax=Pseudooceanicola algae TaxID=1537215 RepID=A0A418SFJ8_9RHOB|nr:hypothetical protein [Pseudooceanicola algae]QPM89218.1 hypothetical protein PSAL_004330 [Pseudooceanicola algae]
MVSAFSGNRIRIYRRFAGQRDDLFGKLTADTATPGHSVQEMQAPGRIVYNKVMGNIDVLCTMLMIVHPEGGTLMTIEFWYPDTESRDAALQAGLGDSMEALYTTL